MPYDMLVLGAGMSGIASAITLAKNGMKVALLEKAPRIAPLLRGFSRQGVQFDTGFHYAGGLGPGGCLERFFDYLGLSAGIESYPFDPDGFDVYRCEADRFEFRFPAGYRAIRDRLADAFPREKRGIEAYLDRVAAVSDSMPYQNLDAPMDQEALLRRTLGPTLRETLDGLTADPRLKSLLSMHTLLYGVPGDQVSFVQHAVIVGNYYQSAAGIRGGGLSLAAACERRLEELGVDVFPSCEASAILAAPSGAFCGVRLAGGETVEGRGCIATVHPQRLLDLVPDGVFRSVYRGRLARLEDTLSAFLAFAVSDRPLPSLAGANRFLFPDHRAIHEIGKRGAGDGPLYLSGAYRDGKEVPDGFIGIFPANFADTARWAASSRGKRPADYHAFKERTLDRLRRQIDRLAPDLSGGVTHLEGSTPLSVRDFCDAPAGGLYGVKHMVGQYNPQPVTRMKGLYLAGQALVSPGVMGAILSGLVACGAIVGHELLRKELKGCC